MGSRADIKCLKARESELLRLHPEWSRCRCPKCVGRGSVDVRWGAAKGIAGCDTCGGTGDLFVSPGVSGASKPRTVTFARGFPDSVTCTLAEAFGGDGTPTPWAVEVVRQTPVVRFRMTDIPRDGSRLPLTLADEVLGYVSNAEASAADALELAAGRLVRRHAYPERK